MDELEPTADHRRLTTDRRPSTIDDRHTLVVGEQGERRSVVGGWRAGRAPVGGRWLAYLIVLLTLLAPTVAAANPPLQPAVQAARALISFDGAHQELIVSFLVPPQATPLRLLLPIPPGSLIAAAPPDAFVALDRLTVPRHERKTVGWLGPTPLPAPTPVALGPATAPPAAIETVRLAAADPAALGLPPAAAPILADYRRRGWELLQITPSGVGQTAPLRLRFATDTVVYPLWLHSLASAPLDLRLDLVAAHRMTAAGLETFFAAPIAAAALAPAGLQSIPAQPYLTTLRARQLAPERVGGDLQLRPAADDAPVAAVETETLYVDGWPNVYGPLFAVTAIGAVQVLAFIIGFAVYRRLLKVGKIRS